MLAQAEQADCAMAPAADMFEMGVKVQVLKKGSMFANRAHKLYDLYKTCASLEAIPPVEKKRLEQDILRTTVDAAWASTKAFFEKRDPAQIDRFGNLNSSFIGDADNPRIRLPGTGGEISAGGGAVWITMFQIPITRIDAKTNKVNTHRVDGSREISKGKTNAMYR